MMESGRSTEGNSTKLQTLGIPLSELLDFSANINPEGPPAAVLTSLGVPR